MAATRRIARPALLHPETKRRRIATARAPNSTCSSANGDGQMIEGPGGESEHVTNVRATRKASPELQSEASREVEGQRGSAASACPNDGRESQRDVSSLIGLSMPAVFSRFPVQSPFRLELLHAIVAEVARLDRSVESSALAVALGVSRQMVKRARKPAESAGLFSLQRRPGLSRVRLCDQAVSLYFLWLDDNLPCLSGRRYRVLYGTWKHNYGNYEQYVRDAAEQQSLTLDDVKISYTTWRSLTRSERWRRVTRWWGCPYCDTVPEQAQQKKNLEEAVAW